jgi:MFS superfamily sulfate permease-like transporter
MLLTASHFQTYYYIIIIVDKNEDCLTAGVIAAIVIASFTVGVLVGVALTLVNLSRKQIKKGTLN